MSRRRGRKTAIGAQFAPRRIDMLRSPAYRQLSLSARKILDRLEIEFADHGGTDNGKLPCTYDDFQRYGIHRQAIYPAIREAVALGFVEITEQGVASNPEFRKPTKFRLTYRHMDGLAGDGSHDWMRISEDEAPEIAAAARKERPPQKQNLKYGSRQKSVRKPYRKPGFLSTETTTTALSTETTTTIDISSVEHQRGREARPLGSAVASDRAAPSIRTDVIHASIASKLGPDGWAILTELPDDIRIRLETLELEGALDSSSEEFIRLGQNRGVA